MTKKRSTEKTVRDIHRATQRHYSVEEKIRIVLDGLRGEDSISELCRREGINNNVYYHWSKKFLEAGKKQQSGDTAHEATSSQVAFTKLTQARHPSQQLTCSMTRYCLSLNNRSYLCCVLSLAGAQNTVAGLISMITSCTWHSMTLNIRRQRVRSPQTNGIYERFHKTILQEFYQVTLRRKIYRSGVAAN